MRRARGGSGRELGYAEVTSNQTFTAEADVVGLSVVAKVKHRPIVIEARGDCSNDGIAGSGIVVSIYEGSTLIATTVMYSPGAGFRMRAQLRHRLTPTPGDHTYKVRVARQFAGTVTFVASATRPFALHVVEC